MSHYCFCGSSHLFHECCEPYLTQNAFPQTAEALMRSRYSAYASQNIDYLITTWHPDSHAEQWRDNIEKCVKNTQWLGLHIISSFYEKNSGTAFVEFSACFIDENTEDKQLMHERSRFIQQERRWYYVDGIRPRLGRNDPCPCGCGKKVKTCSLGSSY